MSDVTIRVPAMWADHHTLRVRQALMGLQGIEQVDASAAVRRVKIQYEEARISVDDIEKTLTEAGYDPSQAITLVDGPKRHEDGSPWHTVVGRDTQTVIKDREMAGDFRRY